MNIVAFASSKGGVGKSTLCILCARYMAALGYKVLCLDIDAQNSLTFYFARSYPDFAQKNLVQAFYQGNVQDHILDVRDNIGLVPSGVNIEKLKLLDSYALARLLTPVQGYDFCLIDASPISSQLIINCVCASHLVITPLSQSMFEWKSARIFHKNLQEVIPQHSHKWKILLNRYNNPRSENPKTLLNQYNSLLYRDFQDQIMQTIIPVLPSLTRLIDTDATISLNRQAHEKIFESIEGLVLEITCKYLHLPPAPDGHVHGLLHAF